MQAVYYRDPDGNEPVSEFIDLLTPIAAQVVVDNQVDRLNMLRTSDPPLPFPYSSQVEGEAGNFDATMERRCTASCIAGPGRYLSCCMPSRSERGRFLRPKRKLPGGGGMTM